MQKETLVVLPAFNEEKNIGGVIESLLAAGTRSFADILVVDDGSKDLTATTARSLGVTVISHALNLGYGAALMTGYRYAVRKGYIYLIQLDADGQHDVAGLQSVYKEMTAEDSPDIVLCSRFLKGSKSSKMSWLKLMAIKGFRMIVKLTTGMRITDPTSGMQGLCKAAFTFYSKYDEFNYRYPDADMLIKVLKAGFSIREIPCIVHERSDGKSMHSGLKAALYMLCMPLSIAGVCVVAWAGRLRRRK